MPRYSILPLTVSWLLLLARANAIGRDVRCSVRAACCVRARSPAWFRCASTPPQALPRWASCEDAAIAATSTCGASVIAAASLPSRTPSIVGLQQWRFDTLTSLGS
jgi:hypothetical protein